jgi:A1 cistron-splicing factor AAR2
MDNNGNMPPLETSPQNTPPKNGKESPLLYDAGFSATPLIATTLPSPSNGNSTFITNSLNIQRSPSTAKDQAEALARALSVKSAKSNGSVDSSSRPSTISNRLAGRHSELQERGRPRTDSNSSLIDATENCNLSKSSSNKSVRSVQATGNFPLGTLRVHSPPPTRPGSQPEHECLKSGDVFIARGIPPGSILGYDTQVLTISAHDSFEGIKDIPAGVHLIWGGSDLTSLRNGFWFISSKRASDEYGEIHVRRWDSQNEVLQEEVSMAEIRIQKSELPELLHKMQSYNATASSPVAQASLFVSSSPTTTTKDPNIWLHLTSCMKGAMLNKITGQKWNHWQASSFHDYNPHGYSSKSSRDADITIDNYKDEVLNFIFPKETRTFSDSSRGRQRTEQAMDSTSYIEDIINENCTYQDSDEIIGEVQFCYLTGMLLGNIACMEHWAHVVKTVFHAYFLSLEMPVFFTKFIQAVHNQFRYDHEYLDGSILDHDGNLAHDLRVALIVFKSRLNEQLLAQGAALNSDQSALAKSFEEFEEWLWKWDWDLRGTYVRSGKIQ